MTCHHAPEQSFDAKVSVMIYFQQNRKDNRNDELDERDACVRRERLMIGSR